MNIEFWKKKNDELLAKAIDTLADCVIEEYVGDGDLDSATDLKACDGDDIQHFYSLVYADSIALRAEWPEGPFSIKDFNKEHTGYLSPKSIFESYVHDIWEESLDEDIKEAVYDRIEVGKIIDKYAFGGGGFEVERELELATRDRVAEKIKTKYNK